MRKAPPFNPDTIVSPGVSSVKPASEKHATDSTPEQPTVLLSCEQKEEFPRKSEVSQETKLKITSKGFHGNKEVSRGKLSVQCEKPNCCEVVEEDNSPSSKSEEITFTKVTSRKARESFNDCGASGKGDIKQMTLKHTGEKPARGLKTNINGLDKLKSGSSFSEESAENHAVASLNCYDTSLKSIPTQKKQRHNGETIVPEMTVSACVPSAKDHSAKALPPDSCTCWRKPLIDQIFITDVTSNFVTVTVKECLTDKGFFRQR